MSAISTWSTTAANNNLAPPDGWPEGQAPSTMNDASRELMAALRTQFEDAQWFNDGKTKIRASTTQFRIDGEDVTSTYHIGRRVKFVGTLTGTIYGGISATSFSTDTTVTVVWDSGSLSNETLTGSYGILTSTNPSVPTDGINNFTSSAAETVFNEDSDDINLRMEGDGETNLFFLDAGNDRIGIGTATPGGLFHIFQGSSGATADPTADEAIIEFSGSGGASLLGPTTANVNLYFGTSDDSSGAILRWRDNNLLFQMGTAILSAETALMSGNFNEAIRIDASQRVLIGATAALDSETLLVSSGNSSGTPNTTADEFVVEFASAGGMSLLGIPTADVNFFLGTSDDSSGAIIRWRDSNLLFQMGSAIGGAETAIMSGNFIEALRLDSAQNIFPGVTITQGMNDGFIFIPAFAGAPSGAPNVTDVNLAALFYDTTNKALNIYNHAANAWESVTLS